MLVYVDASRSSGPTYVLGFSVAKYEKCRCWDDWLVILRYRKLQYGDADSRGRGSAAGLLTEGGGT
jgi:hypothetical protein